MRHAWFPCFNLPPFANIRPDKDKEVGATTTNRDRKGETEKEASEVKSRRMEKRWVLRESERERRKKIDWINKYWLHNSVFVNLRNSQNVIDFENTIFKKFYL